MIKVCNKHHTDNKLEGDDLIDINIMRPYILSNQWSHLPNTNAKFKVKTREQAVYKYSMWLAKELYEFKTQAIRNEMNRLYQLALIKDINLICCCAPLSCHGEIIKGMLEIRIKERGDVIYNAHLEPDLDLLAKELF